MTSLRGDRLPSDPAAPAGWLREEEPDMEGRVQPALTVFIVNRECPWRCVFCDLWRHALPGPVGPGVVLEQVRGAVRNAFPTAVPGTVPRVPGGLLKLYNAGSFFDRGAIPPEDLPGLARVGAAFDRVVVECHPRLVGRAVWQFRSMLQRAASEAARPDGVRLEVAMGLETVNPAVWPRLNKRAGPEEFRRAAGALRERDVDVRAFVLVQPPYEAEGEAVEWAVRSVRVAVDAGATVVTLIPVRGGNGALEALAREGLFRPPTLGTLELALAESLRVVGGRARVFADVWDLERCGGCPGCARSRRERMEGMNLGQRVLPGVTCGRCGAGPGGAGV